MYNRMIKQDIKTIVLYCSASGYQTADLRWINVIFYLINEAFINFNNELCNISIYSLDSVELMKTFCNAFQLNDYV